MGEWWQYCDTCDNLTSHSIINEMHTHTVVLPISTTATLMKLLTLCSIGAKGNVQWLLADEIALIDFLIKDKASDGLSFKQSVWNAAAEHLHQVTKKGAPKTARKCKAKWSRVCINCYQISGQLAIVL